MNKAVRPPVQLPVQRYTSKNVGIGGESSIAGSTMGIVDRPALLVPAATSELLAFVEKPVVPTLGSTAGSLSCTASQPAMMVSCSLCMQERDTAGRYCRSCRARYMRAWRKKQRAIVVKLQSEYGLGRIVSRETADEARASAPARSRNRGDKRDVVS
jgi:hypothetical protein